MIPRKHIEDRGIRNQRVIHAIRTVPREQFVPEHLREYAYEDRPLSIGFGVTISQPYMVAVMTELLSLQPGHRVLEIGTGSGYQAAVLSLLVSKVYSVETVPELASGAQGILTTLGYTNIFIHIGDGYAGWLAHAPFDRIVLTAAPVEIPQTLVDQLAPGGRLVAPVGEKDKQDLIVIDKDRNGRVLSRAVFPVSFVPMIHPGQERK
ncbi:MAG: protein-L-isoaspartate(D-aspartate) O-methyltransferase [Bryobacteraceae bacterium]|nr:protein-L-isoaspartate(D-aspartate) O-methyltransferase [Bryobacteraceae bacterium]